MLELNFNWQKLSVIGGITLEGLYFQLHEDSVKAPEVIAFLEDHQHPIEGKFLVIWDGLPAHRSKLVADYLASKECRVWVKRLPGYAPELNPIEYLWGYAKRYNLANFAPKTLGTEPCCAQGLDKSAMGKALRSSFLDSIDS